MYEAGADLGRGGFQPEPRLKLYSKPATVRIADPLWVDVAHERVSRPFELRGWLSSMSSHRGVQA